MRIRSPSLPELHAFVRVVETGSFSTAATQLSVTQGAVSRAVLRLEARLGNELLERTPSGVRPTELGSSYFNRIHAALSTLETAVPSQTPPTSKELLRVSVISTFNIRWLVPRLPLLARAHPELEIAFVPYLVGDDFRRADVDCWIQLRPTATSRWPRHVQATYLTGRDIIPICHPSVLDRLKTPADLLALPLLHHVSAPDNWSLWLQSQGVSPSKLNLGAGFDLAAGLIEAVSSNMGVALTQRCLIDRELEEGRIAIPFDRSASTGRGYYLCVPRSRSDASGTLRFKAWLVDQLQRQQTERQA